MICLSNSECKEHLITYSRKLRRLIQSLPLTTLSPFSNFDPNELARYLVQSYRNASTMVCSCLKMLFDMMILEK